MRVRRYFKLGQAATELAFSVPILALLLVGTADFGRAFYFNQELIAAARAGAQYGSQSSSNAADSASIKAAAVANGTNISGFNTSQVSTSYCTCNAPTGVTSCASTYCNGANSMASYVTVTATASFNTLVNYPGVPHSTSMSSTAVMQVAQ